jgi:hypothetical protein
MQHTSDAEYIDRHECPLCQNGPRKSSTTHGARKALIEHMRTSKRLDHLIWRQKFYKDFFPQGGDRTTPIAAADLLKAMIARYPQMEDELRKMIPIQT